MGADGLSRVTTIFRRILEIQVERQKDFLAEECAGDSELQARVQELLDRGEETNSLLGAQHGGRLLTLLPPSFSIFTAGEVLDNRYEVIRFIAKGGMGEVYEVEDRELRTRVALKTFTLSPFPSAHLMTRFKREIQLARKVTHPNVCRVYDLGHHSHPTSGDILFLTMELVQGNTLAAQLDQHGSMTCDQAL